MQRYESYYDTINVEINSPVYETDYFSFNSKNNDKDNAIKYSDHIDIDTIFLKIPVSLL